MLDDISILTFKFYNSLLKWPCGMLDDTPIFDIQFLQFIHTCGHVIPYLNEISYLKQFYLYLANLCKVSLCLKKFGTMGGSKFPFTQLIMFNGYEKVYCLFKYGLNGYFTQGVCLLTKHLQMCEK